MTNKVCPKCKQSNYDVTDYYVRGYFYAVRDGKVEPMGDDEGGEHIRTVCYCNNCGHSWHPRNFNDDFVIDN